MWKYFVILGVCATGAVIPSNAIASGNDHSSEVTGLTVWQPFHNRRFIIPTLKGKTPEETAESYLLNFHKSSVYHKLLAAKPFDPPTTDFTPFHPNHHGRPQLAIIANRTGHMSPDDSFFISVWNSFESHGSDNYIIPLGLDTFLSPEELNHFDHLIATQFAGLLAIGGADIDPSLYHESVHGALDVTPDRDRAEYQLVKTFIETEHGMFFGICRGHQMGAIVQGFKLYQDIPSEQPTQFPHKKNASGATDASSMSAWHMIQLIDTDNAIAHATHERELNVNSRHHQAVIPPDHENPKARVIALEEGKIVEALEFKNGHGLSFQFHPEDMGTREASELLSLMVDEMKAVDLHPHN